MGGGRREERGTDLGACLGNVQNLHLRSNAVATELSRDVRAASGPTRALGGGPHKGRNRLPCCQARPAFSTFFEVVEAGEGASTESRSFDQADRPGPSKDRCVHCN